MLSPLLSLQQAPASVEDACYFYDRVEGQQVRWVSYHFEGQHVTVRADPDVLSLIAELNGLG